MLPSSYTLFIQSVYSQSVMSYFERQKEELQGTVVLRERGPSLGTKFRLASDMPFVVCNFIK